MPCLSCAHTPQTLSCFLGLRKGHPTCALQSLGTQSPCISSNSCGSHLEIHPVRFCRWCAWTNPLALQGQRLSFEFLIEDYSTYHRKTTAGLSFSSWSRFILFLHHWAIRQAVKPAGYMSPAVNYILPTSISQATQGISNQRLSIFLPSLKYTVLKNNCIFFHYFYDLTTIAKCLCALL